ncbi:ATP-binding protein [Halothermothrix orenii]|uniref:4Fe-4S ferredoxin iron-sulfur binding domain protein n=1 Tax=Halothermothrix orenii (strain H 168 / OCM 544 / DSM 9562) TaxID=373903 RepID=B8D0J6_HALOH|nr:4Fe-4S dicluster domain-containing protein [Halothermothrix orenii]ACL70932.1 4Fe-4S ferredoxin iron-sulfur binding domain protein [Halothermothrix orenii H 168]
MVTRKIVHIDEEKCNGCGLCIPACHEGAIQLVNGKAKLVDDKYCDGLGDCIGECPQGAIKIIEREAREYDKEAVQERLNNLESSNMKVKGGCPGASMRDLSQSDNNNSSITSNDIELKIKSQLKNWPVQLMLVPDKAPYFNNADLLVTADCVPFAYPNFHLDLLKNRTAVIGCPKLDNTGYYVEKLTSIIKENDINSVTVAVMEVPCCNGLIQAVQKAVQDSGKKLDFEQVIITIDGNKRQR